jgi:hypothetical protein
VTLAFGHLHPLSGSQPDEIGFELSHHGKDIEEQSPDRIVGIVDGATQVEAHLSDRQFVGNRPCIWEGPGQPIEFRNHESTALTASGPGLT